MPPPKGITYEAPLGSPAGEGMPGNPAGETGVLRASPRPAGPRLLPALLMLHNVARHTQNWIPVASLCRGRS